MNMVHDTSPFFKSACLAWDLVIMTLDICFRKFFCLSECWGIILRWLMLQCNWPVGVSTTYDLGCPADKSTVPLIGWLSDLIQTCDHSGISGKSWVQWHLSKLSFWVFLYSLFFSQTHLNIAVPASSGCSQPLPHTHSSRRQPTPGQWCCSVA